VPARKVFCQLLFQLWRWPGFLPVSCSLSCGAGQGSCLSAALSIVALAKISACQLLFQLWHWPRFLPVSCSFNCGAGQDFCLSAALLIVVLAKVSACQLLF